MISGGLYQAGAAWKQNGDLRVWKPSDVTSRLSYSWTCLSAFSYITAWIWSLDVPRILGIEKHSQNKTWRTSEAQGGDHRCVFFHGSSSNVSHQWCVVLGEMIRRCLRVSIKDSNLRYWNMLKHVEAISDFSCWLKHWNSWKHQVCFSWSPIAVLRLVLAYTGTVDMPYCFPVLDVDGSKSCNIESIYEWQSGWQCTTQVPEPKHDLKYHVFHCRSG